MHVEPFTIGDLEALHPLLSVSRGAFVSLEDERARMEAFEPAHWLLARDEAGRIRGFIRDLPSEREERRGEAHAVDGPDRLEILRQLAETFLSRRPSGPLRFVVALEDPFARVLEDLGFRAERFLHYEYDLRLADFPDTIGVRSAELGDVDALQRLIGRVAEEVAAAVEAGEFLVNVGAVRGAIRLVSGDERAEVADLAVDAEFQGQGIDQRLLRAACLLARQQGSTHVTRLVSVTDRKARGRCEQFGFQHRPERDRLWLSLR